MSKRAFRLEDFSRYADNNTEFVRWLLRLNTLCVCFLGIEYLAVPAPRPQDYDAFAAGFSPNDFFLDLIEELQLRSGAEEVDALVARRLMWGGEL